MKGAIIFIFAILLQQLAAAQQRRLVMLTNNQYNPTAVSDTTRYLYKAGNTTTGSIKDAFSDKLKYDTTVRTRNGRPEQTDIITYNSLGQKQAVVTHGIFAQQPFGPVEKHEYVYNAKRDITYDLYSRWNNATGNWDSSITRSYDYNTNGLLIEDMLAGANGIPARRELYTYNASGDMQSVTSQEYWSWGWNEYERILYTYDVLHNNDTLVSQIWDGAKYKDELRVVNTYNGTVMTSTQDWHYDDANASWRTSGRWLFDYDGAGRKVWDSLYTWSDTAGYRYSEAYHYTYNAAGLIDSIFHTHPRGWRLTGVNLYNADGWQTASLIYDNPSEQRYFYDDIPTSVAASPIWLKGLRLFPNPAGDMLNIATGAHDKPCIMAIYNATGTLQQQWQEPAGSNQHTVSLHGLDNGNYVLTVRDADGASASAQFIIAR